MGDQDEDMAQTWLQQRMANISAADLAPLEKAQSPYAQTLRAIKAKRRDARMETYGPYKNKAAIRRAIARAAVEGNADFDAAAANVFLSNRIRDGVGRYRRRVRRRAPARRRRRRVGGTGSYQSFKRGVARAARFGKSIANSKIAKSAAGIYGFQAERQAAAAALGAIGGRGMYYGMGQYAPMRRQNALFNSSDRPVPRFESVGDELGTIVVNHTEFITDIYGIPWNTTSVPPSRTTDFQSFTLQLNPGLSNTFPFLSQIAQNFEEFQFIQLVFVYVPKLSNNLTSNDGQTGSLLFHTDTNPNNKPKSSKQRLNQQFGTVDGRPIDYLEHGIECDPSKLPGDGHRFVRTEPIAEGQDKLNYDHGLSQFAVCSTPQELSNEVLGELHVYYTVKLIKPRCYSLYGLGLERDEYKWKINSGANDDFTLYKASRSNLYTSLARNQTENNGTLTFPTNLAGDLEIDLMLRIQTFPGDVSDQSWPQGSLDQYFGFGGNVTTLTIYPPELLSGTDPTYYISADATNPSGASLQLSWSLKFAIHVEQATSGTDNTVTFPLPFDTNDSRVDWLRVTRFNGRDLQENTDGPTDSWVAVV